MVFASFIASFIVAPFAGAWIEILIFRHALSLAKVAPFVGAWIEIDIINHIPLIGICRSLRGSAD